MEQNNSPVFDTERIKPQPEAARRRRSRPVEVCLLAVSLALVVLLACLLAAVASLAGGVSSLFSVSGLRSNPPAGSYSVLYVEGTIATGNAAGYQHGATVSYIRQLAEDEGNAGILLYLNTGGGGVYESDECYRALMDYKAATGRPVWAYMGKTCASGGYYIAAAADYIIANPGTTTGSIGVYYQLTDTSGLYEMLGIETVLVRSGDNKGIGVEGTEITEANRAVYQSMVDESYERFISIIAASRSMGPATVRSVADGRPYTANQALERGLVDELATWEAARDAFDAHTGASAYATNFVSTSGLRQLVNGILGELPKSDNQALLELAQSQPTGLLALAEGL